VAGERSVVGPVLDLQARHLAKVPEIAADERGPIRQRDGGDEQISPTDFLKFSVLPQAIELGGGRGVDRHRGEFI
jgi:hypothetical protein